MNGRMKTSEIMGNVTDAKKVTRIGHNTVRWLGQDDAERIRYTHTDILTHKPDGTWFFNSGGWRTITTRQRLNEYGPVRVWQKKRVWYASKDGSEPIVLFADGMTWHPDRGFEGTGTPLDKALIKKIKAYSQSLDCSVA